MKDFEKFLVTNAKSFIVLPNDKVSLDDISIKIPFYAGISVNKTGDSYQIIISKVEKLDKFNF